MGNSHAIAAAHLPVLDSSKDDWHPDTAKCEKCNTDFTFTNRRHHCRFCGCCLCGECCQSYRVDFPLRKSADIRACHQCKVFQIDALAKVRTASFGFQMAEAFVDFLRIAYTKYDPKSDGPKTGAGLLPPVQDLASLETIEKLRDEGGECKENLDYLFHDEEGFTNAYSLLCPRTETTIQGLAAKSSSFSGEKTHVFFSRCLHYFVLTKRGARVALRSVSFSNELTGVMQFHGKDNREVCRWYLKTLAYVLSGFDSENDPQDAKRQKMFYSSFIHRDAMLTCCDHALEATMTKDSSDNKNDFAIGYEMFSWMLLCLYSLGHRTNKFELQNFPYSEDEDRSGKGNLKKKVETLWQQCGSVSENGDQKKWFDFIQRIPEWNK